MQEVAPIKNNRHFAEISHFDSSIINLNIVKHPLLICFPFTYFISLGLFNYIALK